MPSKRLLIVDGYSLLFRAFFSMRYMSTAAGRPTNALYGFTSMLFRLIEDQQPDCILVALDAVGPTFRHEEYAEYKGTRRETPNELVEQLKGSRDMITALGIPILELQGYEADDVVGTISKQAEANGYDTIIVSGDLDSLQLVDEHVTVITPKTGVTDVAIYDTKAVIERYGFGPELIPDYKALVGDSSDNIPGVPGVGEKTASKLIQDHGTVEMIIQNLDAIEEKFRKKLVPSLEQMPKSKWLATIVRDAPLTFEFAPYKVGEENLERAEAMLMTLEFKTHARRLRQVMARYAGAGGAVVVSESTESLDVRSKSEFRSYEDIQKWVQGRPFAATFVMAAPQQSMFDEEQKSIAWLAIGGDVLHGPADVASKFFLAHPELAIGHDVKPLYRNGDAALTPPRFDSMLAGYVLQSGRSNYTLRDLIQGYLDVAPPETPEQAAVGLYHLEKVMTDRLALEQQTPVLMEIELPLVPILAEMERTGIKLSSSMLQDFSKTLEADIATAQQEVFKEAGQEFLISSPKQLGEVLFEKMGLQGGKKTKTGWATGVEILTEIEHPIVRAILQFRELSKLKSTYADSLPRMVREDGRVHTTYSQAVAATGRLSSNDPNLQNIPIRTELGRKIRHAFIAEDGMELASFDYSQIELRLLAHLCHDENLVRAFEDRVDVHTVTAALMFHLSNEDVTKEQRRLAKMLNYAVLYGVTDFGLAQQLGEGFGVSESRELITKYFERFPTVKAYTEASVAEARSKGFTTTLRGRRRYFPDIHAANRNERLYSERQAMNAPIQGAAADMIKLAMIDVRKKLGTSATKMLLQVHDELVFEMVPNEKELVEPIRQLMENAMPVSVPIEVDAKVGANWGDMTPVMR
ncbi:MAG: DNA polymerase I [Chthonomonas sp.]|nr:DNA polymerase I [Chthonomonas sp.]